MEQEDSVVEKKEEQLSLEEHLSSEKAKPTKLNKNGKPRKQLSQDSLDRLAKAREKANAIRQQAYATKLANKAEKIKEKAEKELKEETKEKELKEEPQEQELKEEEEVEVVVKEKPKPKPKGKKKTKIIVEQSSEDSDEFEPNDNVLFVKRVSRKKREPVPEPVKEPEPIKQTEPPEPPKPQLTAQQRLLKSQYENMFGGAFMNQGNLMRRHY